MVEMDLVRIADSAQGRSQSPDGSVPRDPFVNGSHIVTASNSAAPTPPVEPTPSTTPRHSRDESRFDLEPMTECDDEYWYDSDSALVFRQPPGTPSRIAFANHFVRLMRILDFAARTIVSDPASTSKCR